MENGAPGKGTEYEVPGSDADKNTQETGNRVCKILEDAGIRADIFVLE